MDEKWTNMIPRFGFWPMWLGLTFGVLICGISNPAKAVTDGWNGVWFTCEFAQRTRAPDDGCKMFDDEGFRVEEGRFTYLRVKNSEETACRGNKKGQCFKAETPRISVTKRNIGKIDIGPGWIKVRYLGCSQLYHLTEFQDFYEAVPDEKKCFWANKRQFYVARYHGDVVPYNP